MKLVCEKLDTQIIHVAIMKNVMGVVGFIQNMSVSEQKFT